MTAVTTYTQNFTIDVKGSGFDRTYTYPINRTYKSAWVGITNLPSKLIGYSPQQGGICWSEYIHKR